MRGTRRASCRRRGGDGLLELMQRAEIVIEEVEWEEVVGFIGLITFWFSGFDQLKEKE